MRVLTVTNMWPTPELPFFGIFVERQVEGLRAAGVDVDVLFVNGRADKANYARGFGELRAQLRRKRYDLVQANYVFSGVIARAQRKAPVVLTHHGIEVIEGWTKPLCWSLSRTVDAVVVKTEQMRRVLGLPDAAVIQSALAVETFRPQPRDEARRALGLPAGEPLILFVGEDRPEKRLDVARAAAELLAGEAAFQHVARETPERVALFMNAADVLLLPSDNEGSPNVVKEAMACNLPIVATDVGDVREMTGGVEGCHLAERTPEDFAAKIRLVLARGGARTDGRARVERLALPRVTEDLLAVYERVLAARRGAISPSHSLQREGA